MELNGLVPVFGGAVWDGAALIVALGIIITVHEFGHYIVGRWCGIHAEVFSLGFGRPILSRVDRRGTRWQIALLPLGGYVRFLGDASAASARADEETMLHLSADERRHTMHGAPLWARAATVFAGPAFNFILSILIFAVFMLTFGVPTATPTVGSLRSLPAGTYDVRAGDSILAIDGAATPDWDRFSTVVDGLPSQPTHNYTVQRSDSQLSLTGPSPYPPLVSSVAPDSAASKAGLRKGDVILAIDDQPINAFGDIQAHVKRANGGSIRLSIWRAGDRLEVTLTPKMSDIPTADGGFETRYLIGIFGSYFFEPEVRPASLPEALRGAVLGVWDVARQSVSGLAHIVMGKISSCNLRGAVSIAQNSGQAASEGTSSFIWFIGVLSAAIGFMNLFPIPILDGGHLIFYLYEGITGKPLPEQALNIAITVGLFVVVFATVYGLSNDLFCP